MVKLLPPYSKIHIIALGSVALFAGFFYLFLTNNSQLAGNKKTDTDISSITAKQLQTNTILKSSLAEVQEGNASATWATKDFVIIDIRPEEEFNQRHLVGAVNAPLEYLAASSFNADVDMVVYSNNKANLDKAASILSDKGIRDIYLLNDNLEQLQTQGYTLSEAKE